MKKKKTLNYIPRPEFQGGQKAMTEFINKHLVYPEEAKALMISGTVSLNLSIDHKGNVKECTIKKSLGIAFDKEAIRVAKMLQFDVPKIHKMNLGFTKNINFHFHAGQPKPIPNIQAATEINYVLNPEPNNPKEGNTIHYTIQWNPPTS